MSSSDRFFRDPTLPINDFFDEGPAVSQKNTSVSGAIDTSATDKYRQGVEIQSLKQWDAGLVKIHSGEPGHVSLRMNFGFSDIWTNDQEFVDHADVSPAAYISSSITPQAVHNTRQLFVSQPGHSYDSSKIDKFLYDGVLNPLNARDRSGFLNSTQQSANGVRGTLMDGNEHQPIKRKISAFHFQNETIVLPTNYDFESYGRAFHDEPSDFYFFNDEDALNSSDRVVSQYRTNQSFSVSETNLRTATGYTTLYEGDFTNQPAQQMSTPGSYTVDGKTWWVKAPDPDADPATSEGIIPGVGLQLSKIAGSFTSSIATWETGPEYQHRLYSFPISQLPNYDPTLPLFVEWQLNAAGTSLSAGVIVNKLIVALGDCAESTDRLTNAEKATAVSVNHYGPGGIARFNHAPFDGTSYIDHNISKTSNSFQNYAWGIWKTPTNQFTLYGSGSDAGALTGSLPNPEFMVPSSVLSTTQSTAPSIIIAAHCFVGNSFINAVSKLRIMQPAVSYLEVKTTPFSSSYNSSNSAFTDINAVQLAQISAASKAPDMLEALLKMNPSTDNYVPPLFRSAPCGNDYNDNTGIGTDSIAFGGLTH